MASRAIRTGAVMPCTVRDGVSGGKEECSQSNPDRAAMIGEISKTRSMRRPMPLTTVPSA